MPRPKKEKPNRSDGRFEVKIVVGHRYDGKAEKKSFYSTLSKEDAHKKANAWLNSTSFDDKVVFSDFAQEWLKKYKEGKVRDNTYQNTYVPAVNTLNDYFGMRRMSAITPMDVETFFGSMRDKSKSKLSKLKITLNAIFKAARKNKIVYDDSPASDVVIHSTQDPKATRAYTQEQRDLVFKAAFEARKLAPILLLVFALRRSELLALDWDRDFDFDEKVLHVQKSLAMTKGIPAIEKPKTKNSIRDLPFDDLMTNLLMSFRAHGLVFPDSNGSLANPDSWAKNSYYKIMRDICEPLGIPILRPHEMRHTCATLMYGRTNNIFLVSRYLGHANVDVTAKIYVHDTVEMMRKELRL